MAVVQEDMLSEVPVMNPAVDWAKMAGPAGSIFDGRYCSLNPSHLERVRSEWHERRWVAPQKPPTVVRRARMDAMIVAARAAVADAPIDDCWGPNRRSSCDHQRTNVSHRRTMGQRAESPATWTEVLGKAWDYGMTESPLSRYHRGAHRGYERGRMPDSGNLLVNATA